MIHKAGDTGKGRLRKTRSTPSTSAGDSRTPAPFDPYVSRQHAEAAAIEAYQRARQSDEHISQPCRPVPSKLRRRGGQSSGPREGSHLEDARLGRRKSTSGRQEVKPAELTSPRRSIQRGNGSDMPTCERVVTRRRSLIPPDPNICSRTEMLMPSSPSSRSRGRPHLDRTDGDSHHLSGQSSRPRWATSDRPHIQSEPERLVCSGPVRVSGSLQPSGLSGIPYLEGIPLFAPLQPNIADEDVINKARDKCLQDFQTTSRLRERKSFLLHPFQRRRTTAHQQTKDSGYDKMLPPFNHALDDTSALPPPPVPPLGLLETSLCREQIKTRTLSGTLSGRLKKVFCRATPALALVPPQHARASHTYHRKHISMISTPDDQVARENDSLIITSVQQVVPTQEERSASSRHSRCAESTTVSRVTSQADSSAADTWNTQSVNANTESVDEHHQLDRSESMSTLRKATSFLGRPIKRKPSRLPRQEFQSSEESSGLFSALQERINNTSNSAKSRTLVTDLHESKCDARSSLPSQARPSSSVSSQSAWTAFTIRTVTPDPIGVKLDIPSPVVEILSPDVVPRPTEVGPLTAGANVRLQRRHAVKAPPLSQEQIARRMERANNRWQGPLDDLSLTEPMSAKFTTEDNPYELPFLSRRTQNAAVDDLPRHTRVGRPSDDRQPAVLSPSVYSQSTDKMTPRPETPASIGGTIVHITGREVKTYSISPPKSNQAQEYNRQGSRDWRRWLSDEMHEWAVSTPVDDLALPENTPQPPEPFSTQNKDSGPTTKDPSLGCRHKSTMPGFGPTSTTLPKQRPRPSSRLSSYMNERYPMIDARRQSSDRSTKVSAQTSSGPGSSADQAARPASLTATQPLSKPSSAVERLRERVVSHRQSIAALQSTVRSPNTRKSSVLASVTDQTAIVAPAERVPGAANMTSKARSAFELRARYKRHAESTSRPLEVVRRRDIRPDPTAMLDDTTIRDISAGPYAHPQQRAPFASRDTNRNTPSPTAHTNLPALSSSEWLAAGTKGKHELTKTRPMSVTARERRSTSRPSSCKVSRTGEGGSPGQRMVTGWLEGKKSKENSPAFV